ncbi:hypothetical protein Vretimale_8486 [Volvox reticuliferus]|uniref:Uncharacterized protein n=1 Tax=Volvox reticuliferus TaxID=1737510 RepID=A0A8J4GBJ3_9CHLO|nr:hypothetical protein Vretimale_8486 [Volvox reticuliferus]
MPFGSIRFVCSCELYVFGSPSGLPVVCVYVCMCIYVACLWIHVWVEAYLHPTYPVRLQEYLDEARQQGLVTQVELPVWLELAGCYVARGQHRYAADVYLLGAAAAPRCAALWRGAGECFALEGDLASADMCLTEANVLDPEDPRPWGWLALVALKEGRQEDAEKALSFGLRCGLDDVRVLSQIADEYKATGQLRDQQRVLQELANKLQPQSFALRAELVRCLAAQHMGPEAAREVAAARELASSEEEMAEVAEMEETLRGMAS